MRAENRIKPVKKLNPYTKRNRIEARVDNEELREILTKARLYCGGNLSLYVREAVLKYKPVKKVSR